MTNSSTKLRHMGPTFEAWRKLDGDQHAHPLFLSATARSLADVEREIAATAGYGATVLVIKHDTATDARTLSAYRIRRGKWLGQIDPTTHARVYPHSADLLFSMPVDAFEPSKLWTWTPGCDVVGRGDVIDAPTFDRARGLL